MPLMNYHDKFFRRVRRGEIFFLLTSIFIFAQPVFAQSYEDARGFLSLLVDGVVSEVKTNKAIYQDDTEKLYTLIDQRILGNVDMELFAKLTLGSHWSSASEAQRQSFKEALHKAMIRSYGKSLLLLSKVEKIDYPMPETVKQARYQIVKTMLFFVGGQAPVSINYAMLFKEDKWVIFDLIVDGLGVGKQFRQNFDLEIKDKGLDALIARLRRDVEGL